MGHFRGGWDDLAGFSAGGAAAGGVPEDAAGPEGAGGGEAAWKAGGWAGACIITWAGAGAGGWGKASFLRIVSSQPSCFSCSSTISLESTSLDEKEHG